MQVAAPNQRQVGFLRNLPNALYSALKVAHSVAIADNMIRQYYPNMALTKEDAKAIYKLVKGSKSYSAAKRKLSSARVKPFPKQMKSQIRELRRLAEADMGELIYRFRNTFTVRSSVNSIDQGEYFSHTSDTLETILGQLRYYNPSAPTSLVTADGSAGSYQKDFLFTSIYHKIHLRNNYQVPADVTVYKVRLKGDTSIAPLTAFSNGLADIGNPGSSSPLVYLTDSEQFKELYSIESSKSFRLSPGATRTMSQSLKNLLYDPSARDSHTVTYQRAHRNMFFIVRVEGVVGHDSSIAEYGVLQAGVDILIDRTFKVKYPAGADIKWIVVNDSSDTFTNGGVVSSKPVSDNLGYSVA